MPHRFAAVTTLLSLIAFPLAARDVANHSQAGGGDKLLHIFTGRPDGSISSGGALVADRAGNLYGTTIFGGTGSCRWRGHLLGCGTVFELTPTPSGGWTEHILYSFKDTGNGIEPYGTVTLGASGQIYGVTSAGGNAGCIPRWGQPGCGTAFELTPHLGGAWTESILHVFSGAADGGYPDSNLVADAAGNLYGTAYWDGGNPACKQSEGCGVVFELNRPSPGGSWTESLLHTFSGQGHGALRLAGLTIDAAGRLYGTAANGGDLTCNSGSGCGVAFVLVRSSATSWTEHVLHAFEDDPSDGGMPASGLFRDTAGRLYGTTQHGGFGGAGGLGTVFEISQNTHR